MYRIPEDLLNIPAKHQSIELDGCTIIESCQHEGLVADSMYVNKRFLLCVLSGRSEFDFSTGTAPVEEGQMALVNHNVYAPYRKYGDPATGYSSVLFFLEDDLLYKFAGRRKLEGAKKESPLSYCITEPTLHFLDFVKSVLNLFYSDLQYDRELLQLKVNELLIHLTTHHPGIIDILLSAPSYSKRDLAEVMEENYLKYASLEEFAHMSGRSLTSFKRDFKTLFNTSPAKWLKEKRMAHAKYLLKHTGINVSEVYSKVGFINYSHFSRAFKAHFGYVPSKVKRC